jgi:NhaP-type Na+/H+ or K+/H+ antiporter
VATSQVLLGVGLIFVLAVGSQVLASRLHVPPIAILLPVGFTAGVLTVDVHPERLLGSAFWPLVSLAVAVLVYYSGLNLDLHYLTSHTRRIVLWLVGVGVPVTVAIAAFAATLLLRMSVGAAMVLGAILVLSGPAVVGPLVAIVRPAERLGRVLSWESTLVVPVGVILGAVLYHAVRASTQHGLAGKVAEFALSLGIGAAGGIVGTAVLWLTLHKLALVQTLGTSVQLAAVLGVAGACDVLRPGTGLIAAIIMGLALANLSGFDVPTRLPFLEMPIQLIIDVLLVSISATVTPHELRSLLLPTLGLVAVLVLVARPIVTLAATMRADLTRRERSYAAWMAPRGVSAAALAAAFGAPLTGTGIHGAAKILPVTLLVIMMTIVVYGLTTAPVAAWLGVLRSPRSRPLLVGGDAWVIDLGRMLQTTGLDVLMWAGLEGQRQQITDAALELAPGELLASVTADRTDPSGIDTVLLLTTEDDFNALAASVLRYSVGDRVFRLGPPASGLGVVAPFTGGDVLFSHALNRSTMASRYRAGARIEVLNGGASLPSGYELLFRVRADGRLEPATRKRTPDPRDGDTMVALTPAES